LSLFLPRSFSAIFRAVLPYSHEAAILQALRVRLARHAWSAGGLFAGCFPGSRK
jgi:hypothetical protein